MAAMISVTPRQVRNLLNRGMPSEDGRPYLISGVKFYVRQLRAESPAEKERMLKTRAEREMAEIKLARERQDAISVEDFDKVLESFVIPAKATVQGLAAELKAISPDHCAELIDTRIDQALESIRERV